MKVRTLIVDDEPLARERLRQLLLSEPEIDIIGECSNGSEAVATIRRQRPDLIFLDVQMPELDGFGVLEELGTADIEAHFITNPGVGSASMEAMAVGLATMLWASPDTLGFAELRHLDNAILVDPSDPTAIAALLRKLDEDRDLLNRIGRNGRRTAMESFTWSAVAASMEQIYESVNLDAR